MISSPDLTPRHPRSERTRAALLSAGQQLFSERAIDAVTVDDIVQAAAVGKGSFYNHFADREALARAISIRIRTRIEGGVRRANAEVPDPARRLARAVCVYLRYAVDEPEPARVLVRLHSGDIALDAAMNRGLVEDLGRGLEEGRFAVATLETGLLYVLGATKLALVRLTQEPTLSLGVSLSQQMCALLLRGLGLPAREADLIAAQSSDEIVRRGLFATTPEIPSGLSN